MECYHLRTSAQQVAPRRGKFIPTRSRFGIAGHKTIASCTQTSVLFKDTEEGHIGPQAILDRGVVGIFGDLIFNLGQKLRKTLESWDHPLEAVDKTARHVWVSSGHGKKGSQRIGLVRLL